MTGFRQYRSTANSIPDLLSLLEDAHKKRHSLYMVFFPTYCAFDAFHPNTILFHLRHTGVCERMLRYLRSSLTKLGLRARIPGLTSLSNLIVQGILEGSPLTSLFIISPAVLPRCFPGEPLRPTVRINGINSNINGRLFHRS